MTALIRQESGAVPARVDWGRWVADCYWCNGATLLQVGAPSWQCPCGAVWEVVWPPADMLYGIVRLLLMRPPENRWWRPGDTLLDLMRENNEHGVGAAEALRAMPDGGLLISATEDRILTDRLPLPHRAWPELEVR